MANAWTERAELTPTTENTMFILNDKYGSADIMVLLSVVIACLGIVLNFTVVVVFLNSKKLRTKIPNMFIINQVSKTFNNI